MINNHDAAKSHVKAYPEIANWALPFATNANSAAVDPRFLNSPEFEKKFFFTIFPIVKCDGAKDNSPAAGFDFFESDLSL